CVAVVCGSDSPSWFAVVAPAPPGTRRKFRAPRRGVERRGHINVVGGAPGSEVGRVSRADEVPHGEVHLRSVEQGSGFVHFEGHGAIRHAGSLWHHYAADNQRGTSKPNSA